MSGSRRYPARPILGVGALILDGRRIVMIQRAKPPDPGAWSLPGGAVETGEALEEALKREVREETGLEIVHCELAEVFERITRDAAGQAEYHYVLIDYVCRAAPGEPAAGSDSLAARWFDREELGALRLTEGTLEVIERVFDRYGAK